MSTVAPPLRVLGSLLSWLLFTASMTLLFQSSIAVLSIGGSCASGGPYVIEVQCPPGIELFTPLSIFGGLAAVAVGLFFARGFGTAIEVLSWPILFVSLGIGFLLAGMNDGGSGAYVIAGVFILMGAVPLIWVIKVSGLRVLLGSRSVLGVDFTASETRRASPFRIAGSMAEDRRDPAAADWAMSIGIWLIASAAGIALGLLWFRSVADPGGVVGS